MRTVRRSWLPRKRAVLFNLAEQMIFGVQNEVEHRRARAGLPTNTHQCPQQAVLYSFAGQEWLRNTAPAAMSRQHNRCTSRVEVSAPGGVSRVGRVATCEVESVS